MTIKIYKPSKTAMQSGRFKSDKWIAEYISESNNNDNSKDMLMGWNTSDDTKTQIKLFFDQKDDAINWAKNKKMQFEVIEPQERKIIPKRYSDNFAFNKKEPWTH